MRSAKMLWTRHGVNAERPPSSPDGDQADSLADSTTELLNEIHHLRYEVRVSGGHALANAAQCIGCLHAPIDRPGRVVRCEQETEQLDAAFLVQFLKIGGRQLIHRQADGKRGVCEVAPKAIGRLVTSGVRFIIDLHQQFLDVGAARLWRRSRFSRRRGCRCRCVWWGSWLWRGSCWLLCGWPP